MNHTSTRRRLTLTAAALLAAGSLVLAGCSGGGTGTQKGASSGDGSPVKGGNLTVQISQDPGSLDPDASGNVSTGTIGNYLFEGLFVLDANSRPKPMVAKDYTLSDDKKTYTITIRDGLKFSDGTDLTSKDVKASLEYWMRASSYGESIKKILDSLTAPDDDTIVLKLTKPWPVPLVMASSGGTGVFKADVVKGLSAKGFGKDGAIGSGPYMLKSWSPGDKIVLERNPHYASRSEKPSGRAGAKHAYLDTITFKVVKDADAAMNGVKTGLWDVFTTPTSDQYQTLKADDRVEVGTTNASGTSSVLYYNHSSDSIFHSAKARDALNLAIDKKAINAATGVKDLMTEQGAWAMKSNSNLYSLAGEDVYNAHDPKKAKKLFAEAGYHGQTLRILTTGEDAMFPKVATIIQDELKDIGVKAKVQTFDFGTMIDKAKKKDWDIMPLSDSGSEVLPQLSIEVTGLLPFLGVDGGYQSDTMDKYIDEFSQATTDAERKKIGAKIQALMWKDKPSLVFNMSKQYIAYTPKLKGWDHWNLNFWNSWLAK